MDALGDGEGNEDPSRTGIPYGVSHSRPPRRPVVAPDVFERALASNRLIRTLASNQLIRTLAPGKTLIKRTKPNPKPKRVAKLQRSNHCVTLFVWWFDAVELHEEVREEPQPHSLESMAELLRSNGGAGDASPTIPREPQAGDLGEEVGRGAPVGWRPDLQDEVPDAEKPEDGQHGSWEHQEASLEVLPDHDGALPDRAVPQLDEGPAAPSLLPHLRPQDLLLGLPLLTHLEGVLPSLVWVPAPPELRSGKDRWKIRDPLVDERCGRAVLDFLSTTNVGRRVPAEEDAVSEVSEAELREWEEEHGAGAEEPGAGGAPLFLPTPDFMASAGDG